MTKWIEGGYDIAGEPVTGQIPVVQSDGTVHWESPTGGDSSGARVHRSTDGANIASMDSQVITWQEEDFDTDGYWTAGTDLVIPDDGIYICSAGFAHGAASNPGPLLATINIDPASPGSVPAIASQGYSGDAAASPVLSAILTLGGGSVQASAGSHISLTIFNLSGAVLTAQAFNTWLSVIRA